MGFRKERLRTYMRWSGLILIVTVIVVAHLSWLQYFSVAKHGHVDKGVYNLIEWDAASGEALVLDGEWIFYPSTLITSGRNADTAITSVPLTVPGTWESALEDSFGYGTYVLNIQLKPNDKQNYAIYIPSVQSASTAYINGVFAGGSGQPAELEVDYIPYNVPYIVEAKADEYGVIEIALQVSNYVFQPASGIEQSLQFGERSVIEERNAMNKSMQQLVFMVFILHAIYAVHLYIMGIRNTQLLYLAALMVTIVLAMAGNGNKLIYNWLPLTYEMDFRLKGALLAIGGIIALRISIRSSSGRIIKLASRALIAFGCLLAASVLLVAGDVSEASYVIFPVFVIGTAVLCIIGMFRSLAASLFKDIYMLVLIISLFNSILWEYVQLFMGISVVFYPFDLLLAVFCMSSLMFRSYLQMDRNNKQLTAKLQKEDKVKDQFLTNTSHELRNPLHGILNLSQTVLERERAWLDNRSVRDLELVLSIGRRMNVLLGDLLDISKLKEEGIRLDKRSVSVHAITQKTIESLSYLLHDKSIKLQNEVSSALPSVLADENRLSQIMFNLLHNAIKYTNEGSISVRAELKEDELELFVVDTGIGIETSQLDLIFASYQQIQQQVYSLESGFGLGLSISKQLVELHGSKLHVESKLGRGSVFHFALPLASSNSEAYEIAFRETAVSLQSLPDNGDAAAQRAEKGLASHFTQQQAQDSLVTRIHILAVDDDPINLHVLSNLLAMDKDIELHYTTSALEVLEKLSEQQWDLIISDVMMPEMSGYALTSVIRETYSLNELPVLLLTARSDSIDIEAGLLSGANDYIVKPVNAIELHARVKTLVALKRSMHDRLSLEAAWLQAQINPHFIMNTLNTIVALSSVDYNKMLELVEEFSTYLRSSYNTYNTNQLISLDQELKLVRSYLNIQQKRFEERLLVGWEVDDMIPTIEIMIPPLIVQSIIENAVTHGVLSKDIGGKVTIRIGRTALGVRISIKDDGRGMSEEMILNSLNGKNGTGIGLYNTQLRLRQIYRDGLSITSKEGQGTKVEFTIPIK